MFDVEHVNLENYEGKHFHKQPNRQDSYLAISWEPQDGKHFEGSRHFKKGSEPQDTGYQGRHFSK